MRKAIIGLLVSASIALAFIQIDDSHVQTILTGAIKTFQDAIRFQATGGGSEYVGLIGPAVVNTPSVTYKLPSNDGTSGQALVTDGSANLSFATVSGGASTPTPLAFGTPGDIAVFNSTELGTYPGAACTPPALALSSDKSGVWTCATPVPPTPIPSRAGSVWIVLAQCQSTTASVEMDLPAASATPGAVNSACETGTNTQKGVLDYSAANYLQAQTNYFLPLNNAAGIGGFNNAGTTTANIIWTSTTTSGNVVWDLATACVAAGSTDDPAFSSNTVTTAAPGSSGQLVTSTVTLSLGGCSPGDVLHLRLARNAGAGSDTMAGNALAIGIELNVARL